jgi:hypothetical protein
MHTALASSLAYTFIPNGSIYWRGIRKRKGRKTDPSYIVTNREEDTAHDDRYRGSDVTQQSLALMTLYDICNALQLSCNYTYRPIQQSITTHFA